MTGYKVLSLKKVIAESSPERVSEILDSFSCKKDMDVESFLKEKAVIQEKKHISRTYLIFTDELNPKLEAYFTVAISCFGVKDVRCSNELLRKMNVRKDVAQAYLIGQIGKQDGGERGLGSFAITCAKELIEEANSKVGCRVIRLDCKPPLVKYYSDNGFKLTGHNADGTLEQMVCIIEG